VSKVDAVAGSGLREDAAGDDVECADARCGAGKKCSPGGVFVVIHTMEKIISRVGRPAEQIVGELRERWKGVAGYWMMRSRVGDHLVFSFNKLEEAANRFLFQGKQIVQASRLGAHCKPCRWGTGLEWDWIFMKTG
jgi:hypothetical protein